MLLSTGHRAELLLGQQLPARPWWLLCRWHPRAVSLLRPGFRWCLQTHPLSLWKSHISVTRITLRSPKLCAMAKVSCTGAAGASNASPFELRRRWVLSWRKMHIRRHGIYSNDFWWLLNVWVRCCAAPCKDHKPSVFLPELAAPWAKVPVQSSCMFCNTQNQCLSTATKFQDVPSLRVCINIIKSFRCSQLGKLSEHVLSSFIATCCWCCWQSLHRTWGPCSPTHQRRSVANWMGDCYLIQFGIFGFQTWRFRC